MRSYTASPPGTPDEVCLLLTFEQMLRARGNTELRISEELLRTAEELMVESERLRERAAALRKRAAEIRKQLRRRSRHAV